MFLLLLSLFSWICRPPAAAFTVNVNNIKEARGQLNIAVYDDAGAFMDIKKAKALRRVAVTSSGGLIISLSDLPAGQYAVSCYHDLNGNGVLDKNWFGIPSEPYGFSNDARPSFRAPTWEESRFYWNGADVVNIKIDSW